MNEDIHTTTGGEETAESATQADPETPATRCAQDRVEPAAEALIEGGGLEQVLEVQAGGWSEVRADGGEPARRASCAYIESIDAWCDQHRGLLERRCPRGVSFEDAKNHMLLGMWERRGKARGMPDKLPGKPVVASIQHRFSCSAIDLSRRSRTALKDAVDLDEVRETTEPSREDRRVELADMLGRTRECIDDLPGQQRLVLLRTYDGLTPKEIEEHTGLGGSAVRMNLQRGRRSLHQRLGPSLD